MLLQFLTSKPKPTTSLLKDPRNQQAISVLFLAVCPLAFAFFGDDPRRILIHGGLLAGFVIALWWISIGIKLRKTYDEKDVAKRSPVPFLTVGAGLLGLSLGALVMLRSGSAVNAVVQGGLASSLCLVTFGIDRFGDKGLETATDIRRHAADELQAGARARLIGIRTRIGELDDPELSTHTETFCRTAALMIKALADDPDRHRELRRHLGHYLVEINSLVDQFVTHYRTTGESKARAEFIAAMIGFEQEFAEEARRFVTGGRNSLEAQLSALKSRMRKPAA